MRITTRVIAVVATAITALSGIGALALPIADAIREQGIAGNDIASDIERIARMAEEASAAAARTATDAQDLERQATLQLETLSAYRL